MSVLTKHDLLHKQVIEIGCGTTFPSLPFYLKMKPKHVLAIDLRPLDFTLDHSFISYCLAENFSPSNFKGKQIDIMIFSKVFNISTPFTANKILDQYLALNPLKILIEEYNIVSNDSGVFLRVNGLIPILNSYGYVCEIISNERIFPERFYEGRFNIMHRVYNLFFCKRDVLVCKKLKKA